LAEAAAVDFIRLVEQVEHHQYLQELNLLAQFQQQVVVALLAHHCLHLVGLGG
jgi:hypothetical protein